jgi:(p)ppGpp synthase/HD superfamily hydrolase
MNNNEIIAFAREAHRGQVDLLGRDYFEFHLKPVAEIAAEIKPVDQEVIAAAWLHDVIEDTPVTASELQKLGISERVVKAVESVTKRAGESYEALITRSCQDELGRYVKLADNTLNLRNNRILAEENPEKAARLRQEKYLTARERLLAACGIASVPQ